VKDPLEETTEGADRQGAVGVAVFTVAALVFLTFRYPWIMAIVGGLVLLIMLHEAGHFVVARRAGMKATEFFLGFGPRIWSFKRGQTEYGVKAIPAGGYVRIIGMNNLEEVDPDDEPHAYRQATFGRRIAVVLAGVTVNFILALLLFFVVFAAHGVPDGVSTTLREVVPGTPAARNGLEAGDRIVAIDGRPINDWDDVPEAIEARAGDPTRFVIERDGERRTLTITPRERSETDSSGFIGVSPEDSFRSLGVVGAARESFVMIGRGTAGTAEGLVDFFSASGLSRFSDNLTESEPAGSGSGGGGGGAPATERPRGIVGIVDLGGDIAAGDIWILLQLLAVLNLVVGLFNLLPLPPFDGGHAAVACYEQIVSKVRGRETRVDYRKLVPVTAVVVAVFLTLGLSIMYLDIRDAIGG
jgi:membrane-associated protease RseP (regulator of RpoE activity)